ncbi:unnamed protein product [Cylindrotheca closterium]|uniref:Reverse transcriptase Ty1/copia-type domain-containing protein n=1 Tax=Cylindrotheca closterium TaxID=2856 RepID=A0AAD2CHN7_9STRA|nr:unnamed protein product [Cylindrotheca closterium]
MKIRMDDYVDRMLSEFPVKFKDNEIQETPAGNSLLEKDLKSHTGAVMTMGTGAVQAIPRKQKLNCDSSTHAELIGVHDAMSNILWTRLFMEEQGYPIEKNILYQDNKSSILLETNGRSSAGKRSRALNIRYFFVTDQVELGNITIEHMPTDEMWADYMTKPLQGEKFRKFRAVIQGDQD